MSPSRRADQPDEIGVEGTRTRRSLRQIVPTERAKQYIQQREFDNFPKNGDEICVKWKLDSRIIWWPATITSILVHHHGIGVREVQGTLLYHKHGKYPAESASVIFSISDSNERFVRTINSSNAIGRGSRESTHASWRFNENDSSDSDNSQTDDTSDLNNSSSSVSTAQPVSSSTVNADLFANWNSRVRPLARRELKSAISKPSRPEVKTKQGNRTSFSRNSNIVRTKKRNSASKPRSSSAGCEDGDKDCDEGGEEGEGEMDNNAGSSVVPSKGNTDIEIRLSLIERQLQDVGMRTSSSISSSAYAVIVALRWSLLKVLERPLKVPDLPGFSTHGLASNDITSVVQCDYNTFRELAASVAKDHCCGSESDCTKRVAFSPSYNTTQSGSNAVNNLNIIFSSLADLTTFLHIRDDNDFEGVLSKEVVTESRNMLRILGTMSITTDNGDLNHNSAKSSNSISASSDAISNINLFLGASPFHYYYLLESKNRKNGSYESKHGFQTVVLKQECKHFCQDQHCFRTPWKVQQVTSKLAIRCRFDLDGTVPKGELQKYFVLNWSRLGAPSSIKWTTDVHETRNNSPGQLRVTIPSIFCTSRRNVRSLVAILDSQIETFMKVRSSIHARSSCK